jgi:transposase
LSIVFYLERTNQLSLLPDKDLVNLCPPIEPYQVTKNLTFEGFILKEVLPKIKEGDCLIMDNAKIHLGEIVREIIEQEKARLIYLPPYSPEFSPIENFWSKVKAMLRKLKARTYKDLIEGIELAMLQVTQKDIRN